MRVIGIEIEATAKACHAPNGDQCGFIRLTLRGIPKCSLFGAELNSDDQRDNGSIQRCDACLKAEGIR